jgi:hypothetical protein
MSDRFMAAGTEALLVIRTLCVTAGQSQCGTPSARLGEAVT